MESESRRGREGEMERESRREGGGGREVEMERESRRGWRKKERAREREGEKIYTRMVCFGGSSEHIILT